MATLVENLRDSLQISIRDGEVVTGSRRYDVQDLGTGDNMQVLASAFATGGLPGPSDGVTVIIPGTSTTKTIYPNTYNASPWADGDAEIIVGYAEKNLSIVGATEFGRCTASGGTTLRQIETEFDYQNQKLPFLQRTPIFVEFDATKNGAVGVASQQQGGKVPAYMPDSAVTFTRYERTYPGPRSRQYAGKRNASDYEGCPKNTLLMWSVVFDQLASNLFQTSYTMAYDPFGFWNQILRYIDPLTGRPPKLTKNQLAAQNGVKEIETQDLIAFQSLQLVLV